MVTSLYPTQEIQAVQELITLRDWVRWGAARFEYAELCFGHGQAEAWDEATALALHVTNVPLDESCFDWSMHLSLPQRVRLDRLIQRRIAERRPAAYLMGETVFAGVRIKVDERALIPRSPLAELIENRFSPWLRSGHVRSMLDLCTGGGCIAVASAVLMPDVQVDAVDNSRAALSLAQENAELNNVDRRVRISYSDLFTRLEGRRYDLIISNPPYVSIGEHRELPGEYHHEPISGLVADNEGLDLLLAILRQAPDYLEEGGVLIAEAGYSRAALEAALPDVPFVWLEFERGGEGVFLLEGAALLQAQRDANETGQALNCGR